MLDPDFLCCCLPLVNFGIYFILFEQLLVSIVAGVCAIATSTVIGALSLPGFTGWVFAILCFVVAAVQVLGLVGVVQEKSKLFKTYSIINLSVVLATFACGAALTLVAGLKHTDSSSQCQSKYYGNSTGATTSGTNATLSLADSADEICDIFVIVDTSLMGGLWLLLFVVQAYFLFVIRLYGREQKADHSRYFSMYSTKGGFPEEDIPLSHPASDPWAARRSTDSLGDEGRGGYGQPQPVYRDEREGEGFKPPVGEEGYGHPSAVYPSASDPNSPSAYESSQQQQQQHRTQPSGEYVPGQPFPTHEQGYGHPQDQQAYYQPPAQHGYADDGYQQQQQYPHQPPYQERY